MVSERLLHTITINSQFASDAFDIIDTIRTVQENPQKNPE
jgi:hypothetical protein